MLLDPAAGGELADDGAVEIAAGRVVDVLHAGGADLEPGLFESSVEPSVLALQPLGVDEQAEPLVS
jgi:hypothetical protein